MVEETFPDGLGITLEMWAQTPMPMRVIICALASTVTKQAEKIVQLEARIVDQETLLSG